ncbi:unnamed protein product [Phaeothamnion confervicola]
MSKAESAKLQVAIAERDAAIASLRFSVDKLQRQLETRGKQAHLLQPVVHLIGDEGVGGRMMGRKASVNTATALRGMAPRKRRDDLVLKILNVFKSPTANADYLTSGQFAVDMMELCERVAPVFEAEPRCVFLQSPVYVFGDIHGNLEDLHFFADNIWKLGMNLTAGKFLFLGDYVDRGMSSLECLAYLFALKIANPEKMFMLRGNHELRDVNGWVEHYGERSFLWQCQNRFGDDLGEQVWETCNAVFDRLPLAAVIDHDIFCVHGGIPRPLPDTASRIQDILCVPSVAGVCPPNELETFESQQIASDCLWSDPAKDEQEARLGASGFGESLRGGGAICFGAKAIDNFLREGNMSYIVRAHEAHSEGVSLSKGAKVFTVFSTSKDHGQGKGAMCGCILVDFDKLLVINRSTKYRNKYVHKRDSFSVANLSLAEKEKLAKIGVLSLEPSEGEGGGGGGGCGGGGGGDETEDASEDFEGFYDHAVLEDDNSDSDEERRGRARSRQR